MGFATQFLLEKNGALKAYWSRFAAWCIALERSKETLGVWYGVVGPLPLTWGEEFVRKSANFAGQVKLFRVGGSAASRSAKSQQNKSREFDETLGYPGEDVPLAFPVGN